MNSFEQWKQGDPSRLGYIGDEILHRYMGITIHHYKDPYYFNKEDLAWHVSGRLFFFSWLQVSLGIPHLELLPPSQVKHARETSTCGSLPTTPPRCRRRWNVRVMNIHIWMPTTVCRRVGWRKRNSNRKGFAFWFLVDGLVSCLVISEIKGTILVLVWF